MSLVGTTIGKIRLVEELGAGGMGEVFVGFDEKLERKVAVKVIGGRQRFNMEAKERFVREAKLLSKLEHPNICRIYDFIEGENHDFIILELIDGKELIEVAQGKSWKAKMRVAEQIAEVLSVAHNRDIVHRDLKPDNVMITHEGRVKVLDFGLARSVGDSDSPASLEKPEESTSVDPGENALKTPVRIEGGGFRTEHGAIMGTPMYMSPEQARGKRITSASDIYSFGLLLQWLFGGEQPYPRGLSSTGLLIRAMKGDTEPVKKIDSSLAALINQMKSVAPEKRPIAQDTLNRIKWIQEKPKRRVKRMAGAAFAFLLVLGTLISSIGFFRAKQAEKRATKSETRAVSEADNAKQTISLLQEFLSSVDPSEKGKDLKVIDLLDAFKPRLDELEDKPLIQASLYATYCGTYSGLGLYDESYSCAQTSLELRRKELGETHSDTLNALTTLASTLLDLGRYSEAEAAIRQCLKTSTHVLGENYPNKQRLLNTFANIVAHQGKYTEAESIYRQCLTQDMQTKGLENKETLTLLSNLAAVLRAQGKYTEAEPLYRQCLDVRTRVLGAEHPDTLGSMSTLGRVLCDQAKFSEGESLYLACYEIQKRVLGEAHPETTGSMNDLGNVLDNQGKHAESEQIYRQCLDLRRRTLGEDHPDTLTVWNNLGNAFFYQRKYEEAEKVHRQCLVAQKRILGNDHPDTFISLVNLGNAILYQGKYAEAEECYRVCLEARKKILGPEHVKTLNSTNNLAGALTYQGKHTQAEELYRYCFEVQKRTLGEEHPKTLRALQNVAAALKRQGKLADTEAIYRQSLEIQTRVHGDEHPATLSTMNNLAWNLLCQEKDADEAAHLAQKCVHTAIRVLGEDHRSLPGWMDTLATILEHQGNLEEAIVWYRKAAKAGQKESQKALKRLTAN